MFRVCVEFPVRKDGIPPFLIQEGLQVHKYSNSNLDAKHPSESITPDYNDAGLRTVLKDFIAALGKRYDRDLRIGFITAGLLGKWGEWHISPKKELFASNEAQAEVMDAYESAFRITPILLRYPAGTAPKTSRIVESISRPKSSPTARPHHSDQQYRKDDR